MTADKHYGLQAPAAPPAKPVEPGEQMELDLDGDDEHIPSPCDDSVVEPWLREGLSAETQLKLRGQMQVVMVKREGSGTARVTIVSKNWGGRQSDVDDRLADGWRILTSAERSGGATQTLHQKWDAQAARLARREKKRGSGR